MDDTMKHVQCKFCGHLFILSMDRPNRMAELFWELWAMTQIVNCGWRKPLFSVRLDLKSEKMR